VWYEKVIPDKNQSGRVGRKLAKKGDSTEPPFGKIMKKG
jgi:hypothetical protein